MSPEQVRSAKDVDARTDIWALGVILYALLAGVSPFARRTYGETVAQVLSGPVPPIRERQSDVPDGLAMLIARCLERRVDARVQGVGELVKGLRPYAPRDLESLVARILRIAPADHEPSTDPPLTTPSEAFPTTVALAEVIANPGQTRPPSPRSRSGGGRKRPRNRWLRPLIAVVSAGAFVGVAAAYGARTKSIPVQSSSTESDSALMAKSARRASPVTAAGVMVDTSEAVEAASMPTVRANVPAFPSEPAVETFARLWSVPSPPPGHVSTPVWRPSPSAASRDVRSPLDGGRLGKLMENRQ
jgi:serine/threonine-protein kinase